eukprot:3575853-Prymnesium_polylepis.2
MVIHTSSLVLCSATSASVLRGVSTAGLRQPRGGDSGRGFQPQRGASAGAAPAQRSVQRGAGPLPCAPQQLDSRGGRLT